MKAVKNFREKTMKKISSKELIISNFKFNNF